jgi:hypothetical protein
MSLPAPQVSVSFPAVPVAVTATFRRSTFVPFAKLNVSTALPER